MLVVGTSAEPWLAAKKDEATFRGFWSKSLHLPLPDYAARRVSALASSLTWPPCMQCSMHTAASAAARVGHLMLPDRAALHALQLIWPGLFARHGGRLPYDFDVSTLALLSDGYAAGALDAVVASLLASPARRERLRAHPVDVQEVLRWLCMVRDAVRIAIFCLCTRICLACVAASATVCACVRCVASTRCMRACLEARMSVCTDVQVQPVPREVDVALHKWGDGAPALAAIKGVAAATAGGGDKASTGKKGGKAGAATGSDKKAGSSSNKKKK